MQGSKAHRVLTVELPIFLGTAAKAVQTERGCTLSQAEQRLVGLLADIAHRVEQSAADLCYDGRGVVRQDLLHGAMFGVALRGVARQARDGACLPSITVWQAVKLIGVPDEVQALREPFTQVGLHALARVDDCGNPNTMLLMLDQWYFKNGSETCPDAMMAYFMDDEEYRDLVRRMLNTVAAFEWFILKDSPSLLFESRIAAEAGAQKYLASGDFLWN